MTERELERRANRRLAVLRHVEEVSGNVSLLRHQPAVLLRLAPPLRGRRHRRLERPLQPAAPLTSGDPARGDREDPLVAEALTLRPGQDRDVSGPLPRRDDQHLRGVADLETAPNEPAARIPALPTPGAAVEALREATPRPPAAGGCEVHRTTRPNRPPKEVLPVHRHRRLHPTAGAARARPIGQRRDPKGFLKRRSVTRTSCL